MRKFHLFTLKCFYFQTQDRPDVDDDDDETVNSSYRVMSVL